MISLAKLLEVAYVQQPQGIKKSKEDEFVTIPSHLDKETGKKGWDVVYTDAMKKSKRIMFANTYKTLKKLADEFEYVSTLPTYKHDGEIHTFARTLRTLEERFKEYIIKKGKTIPPDNG